MPLHRPGPGGNSFVQWRGALPTIYFGQAGSVARLWLHAQHGPRLPAGVQVRAWRLDEPPSRVRRERLQPAEVAPGLGVEAGHVEPRLGRPVERALTPAERAWVQGWLPDRLLRGLRLELSVSESPGFKLMVSWSAAKWSVAETLPEAHAQLLALEARVRASTDAQGAGGHDTL
jgi:hypothetical protein